MRRNSTNSRISLCVGPTLRIVSKSTACVFPASDTRSGFACAFGPGVGSGRDAGKLGINRSVRVFAAPYGCGLVCALLIGK
jgi:hypothetical protein